MSTTRQTTTTVPQERLGRRFGFAAAAVALAVTMLGTTLPTPLYGLYRQQFGFSELMIMVIFATYAAGVIASLLLFGRLSDQIGRRRVLLPGLVLSALSAACFLTASGLLLLAGRVLSGLSAGIFTGTATATLIVFAASLAGQLALEFVPERAAIPTGAGALIAGMGSLALGLAASSLALLVLGGVIAGFGQGLSLRGGLTAVNERSPAAQRGAVASSFFVVMYIAISLPVIGEGVLAQAIGLRDAGLTFAALVAALSAAVLIRLARTRHGRARAGATGASVSERRIHGLTMLRRAGVDLPRSQPHGQRTPQRR